jgi:CHAT domain-containing protein
MDEWQLMQLIFLVIQLKKQAQLDPHVIVYLTRIYEDMRELPQSSRNSPVYIQLQNNLGFAFSQLTTGDRATNLQRAIACFQDALRIMRPEIAPLDYAATQNNLGAAYYELLTGNRAANLQQAIACFQEALRFRTPETAPLDYAATQYNLGEAYRQLPTGNRAANLQQAIACYEETLQFWTPETAPRDYAAAQKSLGNAYQQLLTGNRAANLQQAIVCYEAALRFLTPETAPLDYALTQTYLGLAYSDLPIGDRSTNLQKATARYEVALRFLTPETAPLDYALTQNYRGLAYENLPTGDRAANLQQAISCYQEALRFWTPQTAPHGYAVAQANLGSAYSGLLAKDRTANLQRAIVCYQEALRFLGPETDPRGYALTQNSLGLAYNDLPTGDRSANLQQAIVCYQEALRFLTPQTAPLDYAFTQTNLGEAYSRLLTGDRSANLQQAIVCYQEALRFRTTETSPIDYAQTQSNLGLAYLELLTGDRATNLQQAISCFEETLRFRTPQTAPLNYAATQVNLGLAYSELPTGDRAANLQQATSCYQEAIRFWTPQTNPHGYAHAQGLLGSAYSDLPTGDRAANLQQAIVCYQEALRFLTPQTAPLNYAETQSDLGLAYSELPTGDRSTNLQKAISCYEAALRFWTPQTDPRRHALTQTYLGLAYSDLPTGDRSTNLQKAISCYEAALRFLTPQTAPLDYAVTQNNLGLAYSKLPAGDRSTNLQKAISCYEAALRFLTPQTAPANCRGINSNLANLYFTQKKWNAALDAYRAAMYAGEQLYRAGLSAESKASEMAKNAALYHHAAFSAVHCGETADALLILEQGKTRLLSEALRLHIPCPANVPNDVWATYMDAAATVRALQAKGTTLSGQVQDSAQIYAVHVQATHSAAITLESAITQVRVHAPNFLNTFDIRVAQSLLLDDTTCFVFFCITEQGSMGMLVTRHAQEVQVIEIPTFTQTDLVHLFVELGDDGETFGGWFGAYTHYLIEQTTDAREAWQETMEQTLDALGQRLLDPILSVLPPEIEHLIFLPSAQLFLFPLHAVPLAGNRAERVVDRYQVSYAPSIEVLANTRAKAMQDVSPDLYAIINPEADKPNRDLVFTPREGATIAALFAQSTLDEGQTGTKQQVMTKICGKTYLHFSCHGSYDWFNPTASGLNLADGRLTLAELQEGSIDLSATRLVTLSACETGMTDVLQGSAEEYVGVPAGFMLAGVPCVISSLWAVPDISTALLMERFYQNHLKGGMGFAAALRDAQRWVRTLEIGAVARYAEQCDEQAGRKNDTLWRWHRHYRSLAEREPDLRPFAHPYYWAAFTVNGW